LILKIILNGVADQSAPPLKLSTSLGIMTSGAFYISTRMNARTIMYHCLKRPCIESFQI